jgi:hypothetical protein
MWYEIIPSAAGVFVGLAIPYVAHFYVNKFGLGKPYRRCLKTEPQLFESMRDEDLSGHPYVMQGLEQIPDN